MNGISSFFQLEFVINQEHVGSFREEEQKFLKGAGPRQDSLTSRYRFTGIKSKIASADNIHTHTIQWGIYIDKTWPGIPRWHSNTQDIFLLLRDARDSHLVCSFPCRFLSRPSIYKKHRHNKRGEPYFSLQDSRLHVLAPSSSQLLIS